MFEQIRFESWQTIGIKMSRDAQRAAALAPGQGFNAEVVKNTRAATLRASLFVQVFLY